MYVPVCLCAYVHICVKYLVCAWVCGLMYSFVAAKLRLQEIISRIYPCMYNLYSSFNVIIYNCLIVNTNSYVALRFI